VNQSKEQILSLSKDDDELKFKTIKWDIGEAFLKTYTQNPEIAKILYKLAKENLYHEVKLDDVLNFNLDIKKQFLENIVITYDGNIKIKKSSTIDNLQAYVNQLSYQGVQYSSVFYIPNATTMDETRFPIISAAIELDEDIIGKDDPILAYRFTSFGTFENIALDENIAMSSEAPVIIFNNGESPTYICPPPLIIDEDNISDYLNGEVNSTNKTNTITSQMKLFDYHFAIKSQSYHYDANGENNPTIVGKFLSWNGWIQSKSEEYTETKRFTKSMCNGTQYNTPMKLISDGNWKVNTTGMWYQDDYGSGKWIFYNCVEHDWYATPKTVGSLPIPLTTTTGALPYTTIKAKSTYTTENYLSDATYSSVLLKGDLIGLWQCIDLHTVKAKYASTRSN
jgi:hypothetical protein